MQLDHYGVFEIFIICFIGDEQRQKQAYLFTVAHIAVLLRADDLSGHAEG